MKEKACGAVIYKYEEDELKFLLIKQTNDVWGFSKGHVEGNEEEIETALREIKEETNLDVEVDTNFRWNKYIKTSCILFSYSKNK